MLNKVKTFFNQHFSAETELKNNQHELRLAAATLCVEVMRADYEVDAEEAKVILSSLQKSFDLTVDEAKELFDMAETAADEASSLHPFTSLINSEYTLQQKIDVIEMLWRVVFSDGNKDKYEEHVVRQVAKLLYIPHKDFVQAWHRVEPEL